MARLRLDQSIERKLPVLVSALLLAVVVVLSGAAYEEVRRAARLLAADRLRAASRELSQLFERSGAQRITEMQTLARDSAVRSFLATGGRASRTGALLALRRVARDSAPNVSVAVWDAAGRRLLQSGDPTLTAPPPAPGPAPDSVVLEPLHTADTALYSTVRAGVRESDGLVGQVVQLRRIQTSAQQRKAMSGLIGGDASLLYGNASGDVWTDLGGIIPRPAIGAHPGPEPMEYRRDDTARVAVATPIQGTPWMFVVEFPRHRVFAPAQTYLTRMMVIAALVVLVGAVGAWIVSHSITRPIRRLTDAAEAMAGGDFTARVEVPGRDELTRLAHAFNTMVEQVATAQHGLQAQVADREARLRTVTETAHDAIIAGDAQGHIAYWNPGATRIFGYAATEVLGRPLTVLMPERYHAPHEHGLRRYLATGEAHVVGRSVELEGRRKDGTEFPLELSLAAARTEAGISFTAVIRDITERKRVEAALQQTNAELEAFSYSVSHDLRAPLRAIHGFARILSEDHGPRLDAEAQRLIGVIDENTKRMGQLIDALLAFSQLGRKELQTARVDMTDLVTQVSEEVKREESSSTPDIAIQPLPAARGDRALLRQVVSNLLRNAAKFSRSRADRRIEVGHRHDSGENVYYVRDNGVGFDMRYAPKLFGVFQRLHRVEEFEGTGVGLATVQRVIHRHGGRVWAEGKIGEGATFYFTLPGDE